MVGKRVNVAGDGAKVPQKISQTIKADLALENHNGGGVNVDKYKQKKSDVSLKNKNALQPKEGSDRQINRNLILKKSESQNDSFEALFGQHIPQKLVFFKIRKI